MKLRIVYSSLVNSTAPPTWMGVIHAKLAAHEIFDGEPILQLVKPTPPVIRVTRSGSFGRSS